MEKEFLGTKGEWITKDDSLHIFIKGKSGIHQIGQSFVKKNLLDFDADDIEAIANAKMMAAAPQMYDALKRVKAYLKDNEDILAPFPTRSETDSIDAAMSAAIYTPNEKIEPLEKNGLPKSVNDTIKDMDDTEIRNFYKVEHAMHIRCEPIRDYILKGKDDFTMGDRTNIIEKEINLIIVNKYLGNE